MTFPKTGDKSAMRTYLVGGSVRDEILGLPVTDHDYVVVGSSPDEMIRLGYRPVGKDFPVFLHPQSQEQYALARTERKVFRGYKGFEVYASPEVTLQEDLARRDLTINAIAKDQDGNIIDPFGGIADLEAGVLRHISPAFTEDPVRVLRTSRFAARFGFHIAPETLALMSEMVHNGEVDALVPERVWQEFARGLMEQPSFTNVLCAARVQRAHAHHARGGCLVRRTPAAAVPSGNRYRRARYDGNRLRRV